MDIEQLKLILETIQTTGEGAFGLGITWIVFEFIKALGAFLIAAGSLLTVYRLVKSAADNASFKVKVKSIVGWFDGDYANRDTRDFLAWLEKRNDEAPFQSK